MYLVGGAVRDALLEVPMKDRDWVVVGATPTMMKAQGFVALDQTFPVFVHAQTQEEYALARRERKIGAGYHGFTVDYGPDVTLLEDLQRRDLTINAMAKDPGNDAIIDPFEGRADLQNGVLRHITPAFVEDPIRVLRIARFAARFGQWGFTVAHGTQSLLRQMAASDELADVPVARLWRETARALTEQQPQRYFRVLQQCGAMLALFPELARSMPMQRAHGATEEPALQRLQQASALSDSPIVRFAALLAGLPVADVTHLCTRLIVPKPYRNLGLLVARVREQWLNLKCAADIMALFTALDGYRHAQVVVDFLPVMQALDLVANMEPVRAAQKTDVLRACYAATRAIQARDLDLSGLRGAEIAEKLRQVRMTAIEHIGESHAIGH